MPPTRLNLPMLWAHLDRQHLRAALANPAQFELGRASRSAAVSLLLCEGSEQLQVLLIRRALRSGDPWSGHMALPGGHWQPEDADLLGTALRETTEEIGLDLEQHAELIGQLDDLAPANAAELVVRPFVFALNAWPALSTSSEVDAVVWVALAELASDRLAVRHEVELRSERRHFPAWRLGEHVVWGLTYRVLTTLLERAGMKDSVIVAK